MKIDEIDRKIISLLQKNPELPQSEIASAVNLSQPSVSARIKRMKDLGILACSIGTDLKKIGLHVAKVEYSKGEEKDCIKECPYVLSVLETENARTLYLVSEDFSSLESIVKKHFEKDDFEVIISSHPDFIMPLKMPEKNGSCSYCNCPSCSFYINGRCLGCPASHYYKGKLW